MVTADLDQKISQSTRSQQNYPLTLLSSILAMIKADHNVRECANFDFCLRGGGGGGGGEDKI